MREKLKFKVGDYVVWSSQAGGVWKHKIGRVAQVVEAMGMPNRAKFISLYRKNGVGLPRKEESYVVQLIENGKLKNRFYWPRVSALKPEALPSAKTSARGDE